MRLGQHDRMKNTRIVLVVPALAVAAAASLGACTTSSYTCSDGSCTVNLSGAGSDTEIDDDVEVTLVGASDGTAEFTIDGTSATCVQGDSQTVGSYTVVCTEVGDDKLTLEIS